MKNRILSDRAVDALTVKKETVIWDRRLTGFGLRAYPSGAKAYVVQARGPNGSRRVTVGRHGLIDAEEVRRRARKAIDCILAGREFAPGRRPRESGPTLKEIAKRYMREHVAAERVSNSLAEDIL